VPGLDVTLAGSLAANAAQTGASGCCLAPDAECYAVFAQSGKRRSAWGGSRRQVEMPLRALSHGGGVIIGHPDAGRNSPFLARFAAMADEIAKRQGPVHLTGARR
jgi:hypothetical protein